MSLKVSVNVIKGHGQSNATCKAMAKGIARCGDVAHIRSDRDSVMAGYDACVLWGYIETCQQIIRNCEHLGIPWVFIDLGYWRRERGYYKVTVNDRHPTKYLMRQNLPSDRFDALKLSIKPWKLNNSGSILVAGMSGKAAWSWKLKNQEYEWETIQFLRKHLRSDREIIYRPKPNWTAATHIYGSKFDRVTPLHQMWHRIYCVVSHHSNVCCDAVLEGIPVFCKYGAASLIGPHDLEYLPKLHMPEGREQWAANLAYSQWSTEEMASGECWKHLKEVGLLP